MPVPVHVMSEVELALHGWTPVPRDPTLLFQGNRYLYKPKAVLVDDMLFPSEDAVVSSVQIYAQAKLTRPAYNHSMRVYYFALSILEQQFSSAAATLSRSTLALAALLHNIGATHSHLRISRLSFELYGGLHALHLVGAQLQAPTAQAEAVAEAIFRHQDLGPTGSVTLLTQLLQLATLYDNTGDHSALVHPETKVDVVRAFPRLGWSQTFAATVREEIRLKPWAHTTALGEDVFASSVLNNKLMMEFEGSEG